MKVSLEDFLNADKQGTCLPCTCGETPNKEHCSFTVTGVIIFNIL